MNKAFKQLLVKMAKLSTKDQQWIMAKLSAEQQQHFEHLQGHVLLQQAARFKGLEHMPSQTSDDTQVKLPIYCADLAKQDPLFIAIILEQGCFSWQSLFFEQYKQLHENWESMNESLYTIKSATKIHLFTHWQHQLSFQEQLECEHG